MWIFSTRKDNHICGMIKYFNSILKEKNKEMNKLKEQISRNELNMTELKKELENQSNLKINELNNSLLKNEIKINEYQ
jgi:hypothetical protein